MFKCRECGAKFDIKPDYCDCGNDTFDEIISETKENNAVYKESVKTCPSYKKDLPSIIFFIICIIFSFIILFFIGNPQNKPEETKKEDLNTVVEIPDIDKLWDDTKPKKIAPVIKNIQKEPVLVIKNTTAEAKSTPVKVQKQNDSKPQQTQPQKQKTVQNNQVQKAAAKTSQQKSNRQPKQSQPSQQSVQQKQPAQTTQAQQNSTKPTSQQSQTITIQKANPEELIQYKKALRNKIASNIDFLNVAGDGKCTLSFNISQSGALLNRKFVSQSQNTSLNDAVYAAMLQVSSFKAPPSGYKNETLKLSVKISGGNFAVSLE